MVQNCEKPTTQTTNPKTPDYESRQAIRRRAQEAGNGRIRSYDWFRQFEARHDLRELRNRLPKDDRDKCVWYHLLLDVRVRKSQNPDITSSDSGSAGAHDRAVTVCRFCTLYIPYIVSRCRSTPCPS